MESPKDVDVYQAAYDAMKRLTDTPVSLNFIATGLETITGEHLNTGCSVVEKITRELREAGAKHTVGLIDWDGDKVSGDGLFVLAEGERNGLESVLFDPLLLLNAVVRHMGIQAVSVNWPQEANYIKLGSYDAAFLQAAVDDIQLRVLGRQRETSTLIEYLGGLSLQIDTNYLTMDDHKLEEAVIKSFPELKTISRNRVGELMKWIARTIFPERIEHVPKCLLDLFKVISNT